MPAGRPLKFKSPEELQEKIDAYFTECKKTGELPTITGLALALDTSRQTLVDYEGRGEYFDTIKKAKAYCERIIEEGMLRQKLNATAAIFNLKNNYGWRDKQEIEHEGSFQLELVNYNHLNENQDSPQLPAERLPAKDTK
jgi:hypothetical protein